VVVEARSNENILVKTIFLVIKKSLLYKLKSDDIKNHAIK
tara:strand:+ start:337 stop:456 length:120 start_codon:yes stop_codon:yes gene_type:complete